MQSPFKGSFSDDRTINPELPLDSLTPMRVLHLEDNPDDALLVQRALRKEGFDVKATCVATREAFLEHLTPDCDVILSDHGLPSFDSTHALALVQERGLDIPFIIVSGKLTEEAAVTTLKCGASDFILKDRMARLGPAVRQALHERQLQRKQAATQQALRESEALNGAILSSLAAHIAVLDAEGTIVSVNEAWRTFARSNGDPGLCFTEIGVNYLDVCRSAAEAGDASAREALVGIAAVLRGERSLFTLEYPCHSPNMHRWFMMQVTPLEGDVEGVVVAHQNITERKLAQEELAESKARFQMLLHTLNDVVWSASLDGSEMYYVNAATEQIYGLPRERFAKQTGYWKDLVHPDDQAIAEVSRRQLREQGYAEAEYRIIRPDGEVRWLLDRKSIITDKAGRPQRLGGIATDITERKRVADALRLRDAILEVTSSIAEQLLKSHTWQTCVDEILRRLGEVTGVSRVYIFQNTTAPDGALYTSQRFEWTNEGIEAQMAYLQGLPYEEMGFARWKDVLSRGDLLYGDVEDFPEEEAAFLRSQGICSLVILPIYVGDEWWGFMGLDDCVIERSWTEPLVDVLKVTANTLGAAIHRKRSEEALRLYSERLYVLHETGRAILAARSIQEVAAAFLDRIVQLVPHQRASVVEFDLVQDEVILLSVRSQQETEIGIGQHLPAARHFGHVLALAPDEVCLVDDITADLGRMENPISKALAAEGIRATLNVPLVAGGQIIGAINLGATTPGAFQEEQVQVLQELAAMLALALRQDRYERDLIVAKEKAEAMNRLKNTFLGNISHELRTPLTAILGFSDLLLGEVSPEHQEYLQFIKQSGRRLLNTVDEVLDLSQLESGSRSLLPESFDVRAEIMKCISEYRGKAQNAGLSLSVNLPPTPVKAVQDRLALGRVLNNLLSNAIKFTDEGCVTVSLREGTNHLHLVVEDTGIGISEAFLPHLFDEFVQESSGLDRDYEGTGLGLAIVKHLLDLMGGQITVESEKGHGSTFTVRLPRQLPDLGK